MNSLWLNDYNDTKASRAAPAPNDAGVAGQTL